MKRNSSAGLERNENEMSLQAKYKHEEKAEKNIKRLTLNIYKNCCMRKLR